MTQLGIGIINAPLLMTKAEKDDLAGLAFLCAGYRALKMENDISFIDKCDFYLSVTQLFVWSSHRYQGLWAKYFSLKKAYGFLGQALLALDYVADSDRNTALSRTITKEFLTVCNLYQELSSQTEGRTL